MFTGIVEELGRVARVERRGEAARMAIDGEVAAGAQVGDSIAVNGCCLTATDLADGRFFVDVAPETLRLTTLGTLKPGDRVNLERALRADARLGGHIVSGHVDGVGRITSLREEGNAVIYAFEADESLTRQMIPRGSVAVDGISLTLIEAAAGSFAISVIPHTRAVTTLGSKGVGAAVNLETDLLGKYVLSYLQSLRGGGEAAVDRAFLAEHGFL
jgi:riboflavin synthase